MTLIRRSNPFGELMSLRQAMDRLLEDSFVSPRSGNGTEEQHLALDVYTTPDTLVVEAALPGVKPDDVNISVLGRHADDQRLDQRRAQPRQKTVTRIARSAAAHSAAR